MELETAGMAKQIRQRIQAHMAGRPYDVEQLQTEVKGDPETDELLRIRVWLEQTGEIPEEYRRGACSAEWDALSRLSEKIKNDSALDESVGAGLVSAQRSHMHIVYPRENFEIGTFNR